LKCSWRRSPAPFECTASELEEIAPLLLSSGAAALCWWRIKHSNSQLTSRSAETLHQAYRANTLQAALHQRTIEQAINILHSGGIEPVLVKGWAIARLYPEQGLRPYGDIDLCVRPREFADAGNALKNMPEQYKVDLHSGFEKFGGGCFDEVYSRTELIRVGETDVRVLSAEDHLRILSIHMLREGAWRPLWLCDVAVAVESRSEGFDWNHCLGRNRRWANWVSCALRLARELLGADISDTPAARDLKPLPRWLVPAILKEWGSLSPSMRQRHSAPMANYFYYPSGVLAGFRNRWPNPIEATISVKGSFNGLPRFPFQLGSYLARSAKFASRLPKFIRERTVSSKQ
ncbi:MAG: hypothetical protein DMF68_11785, partial [Acidobacteria bacterium]